MPIRDCIVTQLLRGNVSYLELPDSLKGAVGEGNTKKTNKRNAPTKQLRAHARYP